MQFLSPLLFLCIVPLIGAIVFIALRDRQIGNHFRMNRLMREIYQNSGRRQWYLFLLIDILIVLLIGIIVANPIITNTRQEVSKKGIDIAIVFDISKSMLAEDISPNRIGMAKKVVADFVTRFTSDRLALVIFAGKPFLSMPLTFDYSALADAVEHITTDSIRQQVPGLSGTAIGDGLLVAIDTLSGSGKSASTDTKREKVIILLTDGEANMGVNPRSVAKLAAARGIKIYTIGLGNPEGTELYVTDTLGNRQYFRDQSWRPIKATLDEKMLTEIAETTDGKYYNARDGKSLSEVFFLLGKLTKTEVKTSTIHTYFPRYEPFLIVLMILLIVRIYWRRRWE